jgi:hypothetical protein
MLSVHKSSTGMGGRQLSQRSFLGCGCRSVAVAGIVAAISVKRNRVSVGSLIRSGIAKEDVPISGKRAGQSVTPSSLRPCLVVVLPDGTIVAQG